MKELTFDSEEEKFAYIVRCAKRIVKTVGLNAPAVIIANDARLILSALVNDERRERAAVARFKARHTIPASKRRSKRK